jgi:hypothetical protein
MEKPKKICPIQDGFCLGDKCALWAGTMCSLRGIGVILENMLEKIEE